MRHYSGRRRANAHMHFICPQKGEEALYAGITTMPVGSTGPATMMRLVWHIGNRHLPAELHPHAIRLRHGPVSTPCPKVWVRGSSGFRRRSVPKPVQAARADAEFPTRSAALVPERIMGVETGGCPHTAIREEASISLAAVEEMSARFPTLDAILIESGRDNLSPTFSPFLGTNRKQNTGLHGIIAFIVRTGRRVGTSGQP